MVAPPSTKRAAIDECTKVVSCDMLGKQLHNFSPMRHSILKKDQWAFTLEVPYATLFSATSAYSTKSIPSLYLNGFLLARAIRSLALLLSILL